MKTIDFDLPERSPEESNIYSKDGENRTIAPPFENI